MLVGRSIGIEVWNDEQTQINLSWIQLWSATERSINISKGDIKPMNWQSSEAYPTKAYLFLPSILLMWVELTYFELSKRKHKSLVDRRAQAIHPIGNKNIVLQRTLK